MSVTDQWNRRKDEIDARVEAKLKEEGLRPNFHVSYSAYATGKGPSGEFLILEDRLDEVAVPGRCRLIAPPDVFWGGVHSKGYVSGLLENPTWLDLCVIAEVQIRATNDRHHVFLENVRDASPADITLAEILALDDGDDVQYKSLSMGS